LNPLKPRDVLNPMIEARASKIEDPVAKLRFLKDTDKRVGGVEKALGRPQYWWLRSGKFWLAIGFLLMIPTMSLFRSQSVSPRAASADVLPQGMGVPVQPAKARPEAPLEKVYLVDSKDGIESWSNGLHVQTRYTTTNRPREYYVWNRNQPNSTLTQLPAKQPAGIVFHTTESTLEELEEQKLRRLKLLGQSLLSYVQKEKAYHYVIDRFGRVYRIVAETDAANHAGKSTWADDQWAYIGLNDSFLAISFETQTRPGDEAPIISQAQVDSGRMLTRMLRARYGIKAQNCVTHAQVSINPSNWQIGYHTDWAGNFPFEAIGLPDNYAQPLGSLYVFGFNYDATFFAATGARMWNGVVGSEDLLREKAQRESISVAQLRNQLRSQYRRLSALLPEGNKASASAEADSNSREETK
jgi:hypothetical protein